MKPIDFLMWLFLGGLALVFLCMLVVVCIDVIHYFIEKRRERERVHAISERSGRNGNDSDLR
mgnify:FL=1